MYLFQQVPLDTQVLPGMQLHVLEPCHPYLDSPGPHQSQREARHTADGLPDRRHEEGCELRSSLHKDQLQPISKSHALQTCIWYGCRRQRS
mgnify:FL=1